MTWQSIVAFFTTAGPSPRYLSANEDTLKNIGKPVAKDYCMAKSHVKHSEIGSISFFIYIVRSPHEKHFIHGCGHLIVSGFMEFVMSNYLPLFYMNNYLSSA